MIRGCAGPPPSLVRCLRQRSRRCPSQPQRRRSPRRSTLANERYTHTHPAACAHPSTAAPPPPPHLPPPPPSSSQLIDLDRRRQQTMEAVAQFRVRPGKASAVSVEGKSWACLGSFFVQLPSEQVLDMLQQGRPAPPPVRHHQALTAAQHTRLTLPLPSFPRVAVQTAPAWMRRSLLLVRVSSSSCCCCSALARPSSAQRCCTSPCARHSA